MPKQNIPQHVGLILDGNRRWAKANGVSSLQGHQKGFDNFTEIAKSAFDSGVTYLSAYIFSTENWNRSEREVNYLMRLVNKAVNDYATSLDEEGIRVVVLGRRNGLRQRLLRTITKTETKTKDNKKGTLAICFNYGGREEIIDATKKMIHEGLSEDEITPEKVESSLYGGAEVPPLDLVIRTSGEERLSGFMLYRAAYAELYFSPKNWPDFNSQDLKLAIKSYQNRKRRFGA